jgi:hypothetical protein
MLIDWLGQSQSQSHFTTDSQSVCLSWCRAPSGAHDQIFILNEITVLYIWGALFDERPGLCLVSHSR